MKKQYNKPQIGFAKKSLGQNFLKNGAIVKKIVETGQVNSEDTILEIGPGKGVLTKELLETGATVIAIEKDDRLIPILEETFVEDIKKGKLRLIHGDIVEIEISDLNLKHREYKLIANIPYYITGLIIRKFLENPIKPTRIVVLVQKEVAERIVAKDERESLLSIGVKAYGEPYNAGTVKAGNFNPKPKVDSAILAIRHISDDFLKKYSMTDKRFFEVVKIGFAGKRKMLVGKLTVFAPREVILNIFEKIGIPEKARAENLTLKNWGDIVASLEKHRG